jgi:hypothetical protein
MFLFVAASISAAAPAASRPPAVAVQATATVRIISGVRLKLDSANNAGAPPAHDATVTADGNAQPARLIEFQ